jgi:ABC-type bacteriocin/lantibiotic exporter with double-glycine peptidase domain
MNLLSDIWCILTPPQRRYVLAAQVVSLVMALSTVTGIAAIAPFFAVLGEPQMIEHNGLLHGLFYYFGFSSRRSFVVALGVAFIAVVIIANLINVLGSLAMNRLALGIGNELQSSLFGEYLERPYHFHAGTNSATLFNNIVYETARVTNGILQNAFVLVSNIVTASFIILSILLLNPTVGVAMIVGLAGGYVVIYLTVRNRLLRFGRAQSRFAIEQARIVNESFGAIRDITILQVHNFFRDCFERASRGLSLAAAHSQVVGQSPKYVMECVAVAGLVGLALVLGGRKDGVGPWLGQLTFLAFGAYRLLATLQQVFAAIVRIRAARAGFTLISPDLRRARVRRSAVAKAGESRADCWRDHPRQDIRVNGISFRYAPDRPWAISGVNLRIPARAAVGLIGPNGSGKTTLVDLVAGLLVPEIGQIEVDGINLDDSNRAAWQSRIAYVPQNIFLLDATIEQNVALGIPRAAIDRERLLAVAQLAQIDEFVGTLPGGYNYTVGERGVMLSGGQRQRIGIARALYTNASVLILDESTNALDGLTEQELMSTILRLRGRYTIILIAHSLSTVQACDVIFELDRGNVTASGTYDELLENSKTFRRLVNVI